MADSQELDLIVKLHNPNTRNQAFSVLVNTHQERLYWHIRRMVVGHDDTDDILQNTFIKAFRALDNFRGESQLYTWLYRIATNETISFLKSKRLKMFVSFESAENHFAQHLEADSELSGDSIQGKLQRAILKLPDKQRLVFNMKYYEEMKYEEMSEILGTSVGALKASYHHAVKKIERYVLEH
jgi:RNA polymerase sigma-70 factor (ECF subfamily)